MIGWPTYEPRAVWAWNPLVALEITRDKGVMEINGSFSADGVHASRSLRLDTLPAASLKSYGTLETPSEPPSL